MKIYEGTGGTPSDGGNDPHRAERRSVGVADFAVAERATLVTSGLGSCVAVGITDGRRAAGLVHVMLPSANGREVENPAKFVDTGIPTLVDALEAADADGQELVAKIAGGSEMIAFPSLERSIGDRNVSAIRRVLEESGIPLLAEDVGGDEGRTVEFSVDGDLVVRSAAAGVRVL